MAAVWSGTEVVHKDPAHFHHGDSFGTYNMWGFLGIKLVPESYKPSDVKVWKWLRHGGSVSEW